MIETNPFLTSGSVEILESKSFAPLTLDDLGSIELPENVANYLEDPSSSDFKFSYRNSSIIDRTMLLKKAREAQPDLRVDDYIKAQGPDGGLTLVGHLLSELNEVLADKSDVSILLGETAEPKGSDVLNSFLTERSEVLKKAEAREPLLREAKLLFESKMRRAIDKQRLPLTHDQLADRLEGLTIGFYDYSMSVENDFDEGYYNPAEKRIGINVNSSLEGIYRVIFHEMFHAISGHNKSNDSIGLELRDLKQLWLNEAITDMLSMILFDESGSEIDYSDNQDSIWSQISDNARIRILANHSRTYKQEKTVMLGYTSAIPAQVLMGAYFKQDKDKYEADQRAGTHALRDLERTIKGLGGKERLIKLRAVSNEFKYMSDILVIPPETESSLIEQAWDVKEIDKDPAYEPKRQGHRSEVRRNTHEIQRRIKRARKIIAKRTLV